MPSSRSSLTRFESAAALSALLGVRTELGSTGNDSNIIRALPRGAVDLLTHTVQRLVPRNLNIQPTLTVRPGFL